MNKRLLCALFVLGFGGMLFAQRQEVSIEGTWRFLRDQKADGRIDNAVGDKIEFRGFQGGYAGFIAGGHTVWIGDVYSSKDGKNSIVFTASTENQVIVYIGVYDGQGFGGTWYNPINSASGDFRLEPLR